MLRLVIDTDVMVAAVQSAAGASRAILTEVLYGRALLLLSTTLLVEYEDVLTRPDVLARHQASIYDIRDLLDDLTEHCEEVSFNYRWRPVARDPGDDMVLETAINGAADVIASFNIGDMREGAARFGLPVERPADVLRRMGL